MARYNITALNYMNFGSNRAFFNFDTELADYYQTKEHYLAKEQDDSVAIQIDGETYGGRLVELFTKDDSEDSRNKIYEFSRSCVQLGKTFVAEYTTIDTQKKCNFSVSSDLFNKYPLVPMYDIVDVSIKSVSNMKYRNDTIDAEDTYQNVFAPDMTDNPVGFCQINNGKYVYTYLMSKDTDKAPYMYSSLLKTDRNKQTVVSYYEILLESEKTDTILYRTPEQLGGYNTYSKFLEDSMQPLSVFEPNVILKGARRNYILEFQDSRINSEYDTGNVHAQIFAGKNQLNSTYSMEVSDDKLLNNRRYCGIMQSGNRVYLKFYDSVDCTIGGNEATSKERDTVPYQKIELFNKNVFTNRGKHKSNLFSIKIDDLQDLSETMDDEYTHVDYHTKTDVQQKIRDDIYSAIKSIVENVCPVNTQLFKVYFGS